MAQPGNLDMAGKPQFGGCAEGPQGSAMAVETTWLPPGSSPELPSRLGSPSPPQDTATATLQKRVQLKHNVWLGGSPDFSAPEPPAQAPPCPVPLRNGLSGRGSVPGRPPAGLRNRGAVSLPPGGQRVGHPPGLHILQAPNPPQAPHAALTPSCREDHRPGAVLPVCLWPAPVHSVGTRLWPVRGQAHNHGLAAPDP